MNLEPLADRVVIRQLRNPAEANFEQRTGLSLPETAKNMSYWGIVLAVGPGKPHYFTGKMEAVTVKVGNTVLFSKYAGFRYQLPDDPEEYVCIEEKDIIGIQRGG
jgi:co-chaperonin GroES (HSP10)